MAKAETGTEEKVTTGMLIHLAIHPRPLEDLLKVTETGTKTRGGTVATAWNGKRGTPGRETATGRGSDRREIGSARGTTGRGKGRETQMPPGPRKEGTGTRMLENGRGIGTARDVSGRGWIEEEDRLGCGVDSLMLKEAVEMELAVPFLTHHLAAHGGEMTMSLTGLEVLLETLIAWVPQGSAVGSGVPYLQGMTETLIEGRLETTTETIPHAAEAPQIVNGTVRAVFSPRRLPLEIEVAWRVVRGSRTRRATGRGPTGNHGLPCRKAVYPQCVTWKGLIFLDEARPWTFSEAVEVEGTSGVVLAGVLKGEVSLRDGGSMEDEEVPPWADEGPCRSLGGGQEGSWAHRSSQGGDPHQGAPCLWMPLDQVDRLVPVSRPWVFPPMGCPPWVSEEAPCPQVLQGGLEEEPHPLRGCLPSTFPLGKSRGGLRVSCLRERPHLQCRRRPHRRNLTIKEKVEV
mmetsp:Transcript_8329/g.10825  ORF Transcript_8329/g.10825 Transcript_8329/m.10825 type:complete len:458 (-) Transcript_8329:861-2234(-)